MPSLRIFGHNASIGLLMGLSLNHSARSLGPDAICQPFAFLTSASSPPPPIHLICSSRLAYDDGALVEICLFASASKIRIITAVSPCAWAVCRIEERSPAGTR